MPRYWKNDNPAPLSVSHLLYPSTNLSLELTQLLLFFINIVISIIIITINIIYRIVLTDINYNVIVIIYISINTSTTCF